jgi:hypothetical protein
MSPFASMLWAYQVSQRQGCVVVTLMRDAVLLPFPFLPCRTSVSQRGSVPVEPPARVSAVKPCWDIGQGWQQQFVENLLLAVIRPALPLGQGPMPLHGAGSSCLLLAQVAV